ncbi:hypothetical protein DICVIV_08090 [Dictyocaulus viviparus]|uniref:HEAT repeat protein n=1 Tax=Dictyocaulus viviparus TaxID=29172 RepID=A0A0D8XQ43_DICVI|nr:hypothetical protein DICVIV_08090 [Dictyocaulus viviparus]
MKQDLAHENSLKNRCSWIFVWCMIEEKFLQIHRRQRAVHRLVEQLNTGKLMKLIAKKKRIDARFIIRNKLIKDILPKLTSSIDGNSSTLSIHRKARTSITKYYSEDDDIRRAPVALAIVKLLQKVPDSISRQYLHGIILKLCYLMISRSTDVRDSARKVTVQICGCLGPRYLPPIIKEMKLIMRKGFQIHVMTYTVHTLIAAMQEFLKSGDLDACLDDVVDIIVQETFGNVSEEKEVGEIKAEVREAKKNMAPGTMFLLGRFVSSSAVGTLLNRFECIVGSLTSSKMISRARNLLSMFSNGIRDNQGFALFSQLFLIHQTLVTNISKQEVPAKKPIIVDNVERPESCLLLPQASIKKHAERSLYCERTTVICSESRLQKHWKKFEYCNYLNRDDSDHISRLDPFLPLVTQCLQLKYEKVIALALRCLNGMLRMPLPSIQSSLDTLSQRLFVLLSEYSLVGKAAKKESVSNINQLLCKSFTQLVIISTTSFLTDKHLSLLLSYVQIDILDTNRQATAFALIKALVRKKIQHPQILDVVKKLKEMSITSSFKHIRTQSREVLCEFIGNHPNSEDPQTYIEWFIAQLEYDIEDGRLSAVEMLHSLFSRLQPSVLNSPCLFNVSKLGASLFNEESPKCRRFILFAIHKLLESVSESTRLDVFSACCNWLELHEEKKEGVRAVALALLVQISKIEKDAFYTHFLEVLPPLRTILTSESLWFDNSERTISELCDGITFILQNLDESISLIYSSEDFCMLFDSIEPLMKCIDSVAIKLSASRLVGQCLNTYDSNFFTADRSLKLIHWCCWQLRDKMLTEDIALQASKNLIAISRHLDEDQFLNFAKKLASICRFEIIHQPTLSLKRATCFKIAAALTMYGENSSRADVMVEFFAPLLVREMNNKTSNDVNDLFSISKEVSEILKTKIGEQRYAKVLAECQKDAIFKSAQRKRKLKELSLTNPEEAARLKRKKAAKRAQSRKRKLDTLKPYRLVNRHFNSVEC